MSEDYSGAPSPTYRLTPSQFPPIGLFDTVATAADLTFVLDLVGWTNDRIVAERLARLPKEEWVFGRPNASIIMASFLHVAAGGMRFNGADIGAWYAASALTTAAVEVAHHLRREAFARGLPVLSRRFRAYTSDLLGQYLDIRGHQRTRPQLYDPQSYTASQVLGETLRADGRDGVIFDSVRHAGGVCIVALRPRNVQRVIQTDHYEIAVQTHERRIDLRRLFP